MANDVIVYGEDKLEKVTTKPSTYVKSIVFSMGMVTFPVSVYNPVKTAKSSKIKSINRKTMNNINHKKVDSVTGEEVESDDIISGYEIKDEKGNISYIPLPSTKMIKKQVDKDISLEDTLKVERICKAEDMEEFIIEKRYIIYPESKKQKINSVYMKQYYGILKVLMNKNLILQGRGIMKDTEKHFVVRPYKVNAIRKSSQTSYLELCVCIDPRNMADLGEDINIDDIISEGEYKAFEKALTSNIKEFNYKGIENKQDKLLAEYVKNPLTLEEIDEMMKKDKPKEIEAAEEPDIDVGKMMEEFKL